jgi:hypothetical protein
MTLPERCKFRSLLAVLAFLTYVAAILWHHNAYKSIWIIEQSGSLLFATSYLFYGKPFGAIDNGLWTFVITHVGLTRSSSDEEPADSFLASAATRKIPSGDIRPTMQDDGNSLGYSYFATAALFLFGPHTSSLVFGFAVLLGISVVAFLLRFSDDRILAIPILFLALILMLLTPHATGQIWIDQSPIGGHRFFVIAAILPALHIVLELFDSAKDRIKQSSYALLVLQFVLLLCVISIRMSATYFVVAIVFAAMLSIWIRRHDAASRRLVVTKTAVLLMLAMVAYFGARLLVPSAYRDAGMGSEVFWHRAFSTLGAHPDWPFGNLAATFHCEKGLPEGLQPGTIDRNGHCAYFAGVEKGAEPGAINGAQYEKILRQAFWEVVRQYPLHVLETYLRYKPLMIRQTLSASTELDISHRTVPVLIALGLQLAILIILIRLPPGETGRLCSICAAFLIIAPFSLAPPLWAYSVISTSTDIICYMYVGLVLMVAGVLRSLPAWRYVRRDSLNRRDGLPGQAR